MSKDIIEGALETEQPGTYISNLVITDRKWDPEKIRVTLDCQQVNKDVYQTHELIPMSEERRHKLWGCDCFSMLDIRKCYHQAEVEEEARKLFAFHTPWEIFRHRRMVMGRRPASSEIQKRIRETIKDCPNSLNIKDNIPICGKGKEHDTHLHLVLKVLSDKGITLQSGKGSFGKPYVKWFGNIYSKDGMSPDPDRCKIIKQWPQPKSSAEVKNFLQAAQFNAKYLAGKHGDISYPELTKPLCDLTKKNVRFLGGQEQEEAFQHIKDRLCSDDILVPYDTSLETR